MKNALLSSFFLSIASIAFGQLNERHTVKLRDTTIDERPFVVGEFEGFTFLIHKREFKFSQNGPYFSFRVLKQNPASQLDSINNNLRYKLSDTLRYGEKQLFVEKIDKKMRSLTVQTMPNTEGSKYGYRIGEIIEDMNFMTMDNQVFRNRTEEGGYILYDFWATWCSPCLEAMPKLKAFSQTEKSKRFKIVSVAGEFGGRSTLDSNMMPVRKKIEECGMTWINLYEQYFSTVKLSKRDLRFENNQNMLSDKLNVQSLPTYILTDHKGLILHRGSNFDDIQNYINSIPSLPNK